MNRLYASALLMLCFTGSFAQLDTANITITNYRLHEGTFSWRGTGTYFDRTNFDSSPYIDGHLKHYNGTFRQNFRLLIPKGYDPDYKPGYPIMLVWHGAIERGNCYDDDCYYGTRGYNPNTEPIPTEDSDIDNLLNNDHHLLHGGNSPHLSAWNNAGTMKVDDPALPVRAFPGFVLFPQNLNGWGATTDVRDAIRTLRLIMKKYNIDPDRVYTHGLSNGGQGLLNALVEAPWLFAAAAPMSAVTSTNFRNNASKVAGIPLWYFQGGKDDNPTQGATETTIAIFRAAGGSVRYTLYPNLGHGTWATAYKEPDFFTWFLGNIKSDIHISYESATVCGTNGEPARLSLPAGFFAYQWQRNGVTIEGATGPTYEATMPGVYRARYSRVSATPTEGEWNRWSSEVTVTEAIPPAPALGQIGSIHLRDLNNNNTARLEGPAGFHRYYWYKDGTLTSLSNTSPSPSISSGTDNANMGSYTLVTAGPDDCPSEPSEPKAVFFSNLAPVNIPTPTGFAGALTSPTTVLLRWNDVSGSERHYEIWRRKSTDPSANGWTFVTLTDEDAIIYEDKNLEPATEYWYKIRAVSNTGRSNYAPGESKTNPAQNLIISTGADNTPPTVPQNLTAEQHDTDIATKTVSMRLTWSASTDGGGVKEYDILYGGQTVTVPASEETEYILTGLPLNTVYDFRVVARDVSGNVSTPSNQVNANTYIDGFFWQHSTAAYTDIRDIPANFFDDPEFEGRSPNLTLEPALQEEFLVFRYYGYLYISTAGMHQLRMRSNDGVHLYVDGELLIARNRTVTTTECATTNFGPNEPRFFDAGVHSIEVRYFQYTGPKCLSMQWRGPDAGPDATVWHNVPDDRIRSYGSPPDEQVPPTPTDLAAVANGMTQIDLSWSFAGAPPVEFEIHRSDAADGTFTVVNRVDAETYADMDLQPGATYFYKLRTVSPAGVSEFSEVVSATTEGDTEPPTQPTALTLFSKTLTSASIAWTASEDNTSVTGYEIWVNDILHGTAPSNFYLIEGLQPLQTYAVYVVAFDPNDNKSEPSNTITFDTSDPQMFYSKASGDLNAVATWGINPDGSGDSPANFSTNGSYFVLANRATTNVGGSWKVEGSASKIVVPSGTTLTTESPVQGRMEVEDGATVVLANATIPAFVDLGTASVVQYNQSAQQVQAAEYGTLILSGTGNKIFPSGTITVHANLEAANGIGLRGAGGNQSTIVLFGDLTFAGTPAVTPAGNTIALDMRKSGTQTLSYSGSLPLYTIKTGPATSIALANGGTPVTLLLGSGAGGGLSLAEGSALLLGENTLQLTGAATINAGGETGTIHIDNGTLDITSSSAQHSHLYTDDVNNRVGLLRSSLTGAGNLVVETPVLITDGLKIAAGTLDANGNVTLLSDATKTANLQAIENNGRVIGNVHVQRFISEKTRTYRYFSSPVEGITVADWQEFFPITGPFDGTSTGPGLSTQHSLFTREPEGWVGYPSSGLPAPYDDNQAPVERGKGYAAFIRNDAHIEMVSTGVPYQGVIAFDVYGPQAGVEDGGWNLLGNPYASTISWNNSATAWTKSQISNVVAVRNNTNNSTGQFMYYDAATGLGTGEGGILAGGRIAPGQAFWVEATGSSPSISIREPAKSTEQQELFRESASDFSHVKLNLRRDAQSDQALIVLAGLGTDAYDAGVDGLKMGNEGIFNLATLTENGLTVAINHMEDAFCSKTVGISLQNTQRGTYTLAIESSGTLSGVGSLRLLDHYANTSVDLLESAYTFTISADTASSGDQRFELTFERPAIDTSVAGIPLVHCADVSQITLTGTQRGAVYAVLGKDLQPVGQAQTSAGTDLTFDIPTERLVDGINEFTVQASFPGCNTETMANTVTLEYMAPPSVSGTDAFVCAGSTATLRVVASGEVSHYEWHGPEGLIKGVTGPELTTGPVVEERHYVVSAVSPNGCVGPRFQLTVSPDSLAIPTIMSAGDSLVSSVHASHYTWMRNDKVVHASSSAWFYVPEKAGRYMLTVRNGDCARTSEAFVVNRMGGASEKLVSDLYPNPATADNVNLRVRPSGLEPVRISILDALGREAFTAVYSPEELEDAVRLPLGNRLKAGIYFLQVEQNSGKEKIKFIIQE